MDDANASDSPLGTRLFSDRNIEFFLGYFDHRLQGLTLQAFLLEQSFGIGQPLLKGLKRIDGRFFHVKTGEAGGLKPHGRPRTTRVDSADKCDSID